MRSGRGSSRCAAASTKRFAAAWSWPIAALHARQLAQPAPDRGPEDRGVRDRRGARPRTRRARAALRRRRQHGRLRQGLRRGGRADAARLRAGGRARRHVRLGDPHHRARAPRGGGGADRREPRRDRHRLRRGDHGRLARDRKPRGHLLRAVVRRGLRGACSRRLEPGSTVVCVLTGHGLKDTAAVDVLTEATTVVEASLDAILAEVGQ